MKLIFCQHYQNLFLLGHFHFLGQYYSIEFAHYKDNITEHNIPDPPLELAEMEKRCSSPRNLQFISITSNFYVIPWPNSFQLWGERTHKNPFIGRSVCLMKVKIHGKIESEHVLCFKGILDLLNKYGSEIWYDYFDFYNSLFDSDPVQLYQRL